MAQHVCPWWYGYVLANPMRKLIENPREILSPFVKEGMTVLEPGCGMGFFTVELARLVGERGEVIAVDLQPKMLAGLKKRLSRAGLSERVRARAARPDTLDISDLAAKVDFALAFYLVHEVPDKKRFFTEVHQALKPEARLLLVEPKGHVSKTAFDASLSLALEAGFVILNPSVIRRRYSALLEKIRSDAVTPLAS
jgi:ubiquinone/menaquinone biosynthesis C-methylase UbiE